MAKREPNLVTCVCTANICRSPMAAKLLEHALSAEDNGSPLKQLKVVSAGVAAWSGDKVSENSVVAMRKVGLDISNHRSQPLTREIMEQSVLVLGMTDSHKTMIVRAFPDIQVPVLLFRELLPANADPQIPDPFGSGIRTYEESRDSMVEAVPSIIAFLRTLLGADEADQSGQDSESPG